MGVPLPGSSAATVAVNVTDWFKSEGLPEETTLVVVAVAGLLVRLKLVETETRPMDAVTVYGPPTSGLAVALTLACPDPLIVAVVVLLPEERHTGTTGRPKEGHHAALDRLAGRGSTPGQSAGWRRRQQPRHSGRCHRQRRS